jgi:hypothetical protein
MQGKNKEGIKLFLAGVSSPFVNLPYLHLLWKQYTGKSKRGDETYKFLIFKLVLTVQPHLGICLSCTFFVFVSFFNQSSLVKIKS